MLYLSLGLRALGKLLGTEKIFEISHFSETKLWPRMPWGHVSGVYHAMILLLSLSVISSGMAWYDWKPSFYFPSRKKNAAPVPITNFPRFGMAQSVWAPCKLRLRFSWLCLCCCSLGFYRGPMFTPRNEHGRSIYMGRSDLPSSSSSIRVESLLFGL